MVYKNGNCEDMYVSIANVAFNISLYFLYTGNHESTEDLGWMTENEIRNEMTYALLHLQDGDWTVETGVTTENSLGILSYYKCDCFICKIPLKI